jgi:DNA primase
MTLSPAFLDELRARTLLSAVIAPSVKLIKSGREWKACCPFHQEKTPSFTVNDEKGFYHCFGCGAHGDAIRFLTDQRGLPFIDAVKELAGKAGMEVPASDPRAKERAEASAGLTDVMAAAQRWFAEQLSGTEGGAARDYLTKRGIDPETIARFGLGLAPNARTRLKAALASHGEDKLVETGMLIKPDDGGEPYDRFRGRLMMPIRDARGRVIAFGGRILGDGEPKYLNSPETVLFDKGRTLYNIDRASPASRAAKRVIVVEGYMDVIALDTAGIAEVVAPNGTAVTEAQLERMWRLDPAPLLCFDGDSAGQKASTRAAFRALPYVGPDRTLRFVTMPPGEDPDDVVKKGGRPAFEALVDAAEPLVERLWRHERDAAPLATPEERASLKARLMAHAGTIGDNSVRSLYRDEWLGRFDTLFARAQPARREWKPGKWKPGARGGYVPAAAPMGQVARAIGAGGIDRATARGIIAGFAYFPQALPQHIETLACLPISDPPAAYLRDRLVDAAMTGTALDRGSLDTILEAAGAAAALKDVRRSGGMKFTFNRGDSDPDLAVRDLTEAVEALVTKGEIEAALAEATERLKAGDASAFDEQLRLHAARDEATERLASLATSD